MKKKDIFKIFLIFFAIIVFSGITVWETLMVSSGKSDLRSLAGNVDRQVKILFYPSSVNEKSGNTFPVVIQLSAPAKKSVGSVLLTISFDQTQLQLQGMNNSAIPNNLQYLKSTDITKSNTTGQVKVMYGATATNNGPSGNFNLSTLNFSVIKESTGKISIDPSNSQITFLNSEVADLIVNNSVDVNSFPTPTAKPPTPLPSP